MAGCPPKLSLPVTSLRANGSAPTGRANARPMTGSAPPDDRLSEAIQALEARMDCFVAEFIIGPAEGGTRWLLAMTSQAVVGCAKRSVPTTLNTRRSRVARCNARCLAGCRHALGDGSPG